MRLLGTRAFFIQTLALLPLLVTAQGCATNDDGRAARHPTVVSSLALGNPLGLPAASDAAGVVLQVDWLEPTPGAPAPPGQPIAALSRLITNVDGDPLPVAGAQAEAILLVSADQLPPQAVIRQSQTVVVPPGCTATLAIELYDDHGNAHGTATASVLVAAPGFGGIARPRLIVRASPTAEEISALVSSGETGATDHFLLLDWPASSIDATFGISLPPLDGRPPILLRIQASGIIGDSHDAEMATALFAGLRAESGALSVSGIGGRQRTLLEALARASTPGARRRALAYVCLDSGADTAGELVTLVVDDGAAELLVEAARQALVATPADASREQSSWLLDRAVLIAAAGLVQTNQFSREALAALSAQFGEVGRDPVALAQLAAAAGTREDFHTRLQAEHLILLEDASPASRVRAFDWLAARGQAPPGYDPLGRRRERRAALDAYYEKQQSSATPN